MFRTNWLRAFWRDDTAATAIEYSLIAALTTVVIIAALTLFGDEMGNMYNSIGDAVSGAV